MEAKEYYTMDDAFKNKFFGQPNFTNEESLIFSNGNIKFFSQIKDIKPNKLKLNLDLSTNYISFIDGEILKKISSIQNLNLSKNTISRIRGLSSLSDLEYLNLSHNRVNTLDNLDQNEKLKQLLIYANQIKFVSLRTVMHKLTYLDISNNKLSYLNFGNKMPNLKYLIAKNNFVVTLPDFSQFKKLLFLDLSCNKISELGKVCPNNIRTMILSNNNFRSVNDVSNFQKLIALDISYNPISDKSFSSNSKINLLKYIDVSHTRITDIEIIKSLNDQFVGINLSNTDIDSLDSILKFLSSQIFLEELDIRNTKVSGSLHISLSSQLNQSDELEEVKYIFHKNPDVAQYRRRIMEFCPTLKKLDGINVYNDILLNKLNTTTSKVEPSDLNLTEMNSPLEKKILKKTDGESNNKLISEKEYHEFIVNSSPKISRGRVTAQNSKIVGSRRFSPLPKASPSKYRVNNFSKTYSGEGYSAGGIWNLQGHESPRKKHLVAKNKTNKGSILSRWVARRRRKFNKIRTKQRTIETSEIINLWTQIGGKASGSGMNSSYNSNISISHKDYWNSNTLDTKTTNNNEANDQKGKQVGRESLSNIKQFVGLTSDYSPAVTYEKSGNSESRKMNISPQNLEIKPKLTYANKETQFINMDDYLRSKKISRLVDDIISFKPNYASKNIDSNNIFSTPKKYYINNGTDGTDNESTFTNTPPDTPLLDSVKRKRNFTPDGPKFSLKNNNNTIRNSPIGESPIMIRKDLTLQLPDDYDTDSSEKSDSSFAVETAPTKHPKDEGNKVLTFKNVDIQSPKIKSSYLRRLALEKQPVVLEIRLPTDKLEKQIVETCLENYDYKLLYDSLQKWINLRFARKKYIESMKKTCSQRDLVKFINKCFKTRLFIGIPAGDVSHLLFTSIGNLLDDTNGRCELYIADLGSTGDGGFGVDLPSVDSVSPEDKELYDSMHFKCIGISTYYLFDRTKMCKLFDIRLCDRTSYM